MYACHAALILRSSGEVRIGAEVPMSRVVEKEAEMSDQGLAAGVDFEAKSAQWAFVRMVTLPHGWQPQGARAIMACSAPF